MRYIISVIMIILLVIGSQVFAQIVETHEFGATNVQNYIYSDGREWKFVAENTMTVGSIEVKSVLASATRGNFHIEISIADSLLAKWDKIVYNSTYQPYIHTKEVGFLQEQGDTIVYKIYGDYFYTAAGAIRGISHIKLTEPPVSIDFSEVKPLVYSLNQNYPNPFNPVTTIEFSVKQRSLVSLQVFNIGGSEVLTLLDQVYAPGNYNVRFNGDGLPSGVYIYRIKMDGFQQVRKMTLMK